MLQVSAFHLFDILNWIKQNVLFVNISVSCRLTSYFVFTFSLSGGELFDQIADEDYKMTEAEVIHYMRQICDGLRHMHEQNIVHLDVKVFWLTSCWVASHMNNRII